MNPKLVELVDRLKPAFGDRLISAVLYGSAASGDYNENTSDFNVLCVLSEITPHELVQSEPVFRWWREQGNPPPLLLSAEEVRTSTDSFPMEFHDMQEQRKLLYGEDVIASLDVDRSFYRAQVEHELRAKQIRLRQKATELLSNGERLIQLMADSVSTFCVLGRHALILGGHEAKWKKSEVVTGLEDVTVMPFTAMNEILTLRENPKAKGKIDAGTLFSRYLKEIDALVRYVDRLDRSAA